jgi:hypothetical protein
LSAERGTADDYASILESLYPGRWLQLLVKLQGKSPAVSGEGWNARAVARWEGAEPEVSPQAIAEALAGGFNVGLVVPPGVIVLDCDSRGAGDWVWTWLDGIKPAVQDSSAELGKRHFWFRLPGELEEDVRQAGCEFEFGTIDVRCSGRGMVAVEPSIHPETDLPYRWQPGRELPADADDLPEIPLELLKAIVDAQKPVEKRESAAPQTWEDAAAEPLVLPGNRHRDCYEVACKIVAKGLHPQAAVLGAVRAIAAVKYRTAPISDADIAHAVESAWKGLARPPVTDPVTGRPAPIGRLYSEIDRTYIEWLWREYIPVGGLVVMDGEGGIGKSLLTCDLAARVTTGREWPDGAPGAAPGGVVLVCSEEDAGETILPRLQLAKADLSRVLDLRHPEILSVVDLAPIAAAVNRVKAKLVLFDPITDYLGGIQDAHKDDQVRGMMIGLRNLAREKGFSVWCNRHVSKSASGGRAMHAGMGSVGWTNQARNQMLCCAVPDRPGRGRLGVSKTNVADPAIKHRVLEYEVTSEGEFDPGMLRIEWAPEPIALSTEDAWKISTGEAAEVVDLDGSLMAERPTPEPRGTPKTDAAEQFFRDALELGPMSSRELYRRAGDEGHKDGSLKSAKSNVGVLSYREDGEWMSRLP